MYIRTCFIFFQKITRKVMVSAANGKALPLFTVIEKCLNYMKTATIDYLDKQIQFPNRKIRWILTVPAIWSPGAKQMMRKAAEQVCSLTCYVHTNVCMYVCLSVCLSVCMYVCMYSIA